MNPIGSKAFTPAIIPDQNKSIPLNISNNLNSQLEAQSRFFRTELAELSIPAAQQATDSKEESPFFKKEFFNQNSQVENNLKKRKFSHETEKSELTEDTRPKAGKTLAESFRDESPLFESGILQIDSGERVQPTQRKVTFIESKVFRIPNRYENRLKEQKAFSIQSKWATDYLDKGIELYRSNEFTEALEYFGKTLELDPKNLEALMFRAKAFYRLDDYKNADYALIRSLEINPYDSRAYYKRARLALLLNNDSCAMYYAKASLGLDYHQPKLQKLFKISLDSECFVRAGHLYYNTKKYEMAEIYFDRAIVLDPQDLQAHLFKGASLLYLEEYEEADDALDKAQEINPDDSRIYFFRALVAFEKKNYSLAQISAQLSLALQPSQTKMEQIIEMVNELAEEVEANDANDDNALINSINFESEQLNLQFEQDV